MAQQVAAGKLQSALIVSPQIEFPGGVDTECVNGRPGQPPGRDLADPGRARTGSPTPSGCGPPARPGPASACRPGAGARPWRRCCTRRSTRLPSSWAATSARSSGPSTSRYLPSSPLTRRYDLVALARRRPPPVAMWLETSHADPVSYTLECGVPEGDQAAAVRGRGRAAARRPPAGPVAGHPAPLPGLARGQRARLRAGAVTRPGSGSGQGGRVAAGSRAPAPLGCAPGGGVVPARPVRGGREETLDPPLGAALSFPIE